MAKILASSKLLPVTIVGLAAVLSLKAYAVIATAPSLAEVRSGAGQMLAAAGATASAGVIAQAHATSPQPAAEAGPRADAPPAPVRPAAAAVPASAVTPQAALPAPEVTAPASPPPGVPATAGLPPDASPFRRSQMEERERQVTQREAATAAAEKRISERVSELMALQERLQALEGGLKQRDEANWTGLVKLYEGMKPRDAAVIFNALDKPVLLEILDRMKPAKASPVLASMEAERARQVTAELAARRTKATTGAD